MRHANISSKQRKIDANPISCGVVFSGEQQIETQYQTHKHIHVEAKPKQTRNFPYTVGRQKASPRQGILVDFFRPIDIDPCVESYRIAKHQSQKPEKKKVSKLREPEYTGSF